MQYKQFKYLTNTYRLPYTTSPMQNLQKIKSLYRSGRFQCDLFFYTKLQQIAYHLNVYQYIPAILKNKHIVHNISDLTKKHLIVLQDQDNQQKALDIIHEINRHVTQIDTTFINNIFQQIQKMNGKSYQHLLILYIKGQACKKMYTDTFDRIMNNVHDPKLKLDQLLTLGLFIGKNGDKVNSFVTIYGIVLENGINQLKKYRQNCQFIQQNLQIQQHPKVNAYLRGSKILVLCLIKFNQIYKLVSGDSKYGLKLTALKKDIQAYSVNKKQQHNNHNNINTNKNSNIKRPLKQFKKFLLTGKQLPTICSLCLYQQTNGDHNQCRNTIQLLYQHKQINNE